MNYFQAQAKAKQTSLLLIVIFIVGVISIILLTNIFIMLVLSSYQGDAMLLSQDSFLTLFDSYTFFSISIAVVAIVVLGSLYKLRELSSGGHVVAEALGGKLVPRDTRDAKYRQLLNVVDEMAIASGIAAPPVYVLDEEGINAFAAGLSFDDAVIGVTQGALDSFEREELQGVIAHEFSHIFNGDMRLNIRIIGLLHGILLIGLIGREILNTFGRSRRIRSGSGKKNDGQGAIIMLGAGLSAIGFVGTTVGEIIKALISQQREYLADASAVQFTRYPLGIANALRKIGAKSSSIKSSSSSIYSHLYFADGVSDFWDNLFSTHPKLNDRILRIYPRWDGSYISKKEPKNIYKRDDKSQRKESVVEAVTTAAILSAMEQIGEASEPRVNQAVSILESIPNSLKGMSENPLTAQAVIFALLCSADAKVFSKQMKSIESYSEMLLKHAQLALMSVESLKRELYLPLLKLCITSLKMMSVAQYKLFKKCTQELVDADDKLSLFEWSMNHLVFTQLDFVFGMRKIPKEKYSHIGAIREEITIFISILAKEQKSDDSAAKEAFDSAKNRVGASSLQYMSQDLDTYELLEQVVLALQSAKIGVRKKVLDMAIATLEHDGLISSQDFEILNATSSILRLPLPLMGE